MLQKTADELEHIDGHLSRAPATAFAIGEGHGLVNEGDYPSVADSHAEHIRCEALQARTAIAGRLRVHDPILLPRSRVDLVEEAGELLEIV